MTRFERAFSSLAERGDPVGATALIESLDRDLAADTPLVSVPARGRRPVPGVVIGAAALVTVLAAGLAWAFLAGLPGRVVDRDGVDWVTVDLDAGEDVSAGPGGFVRTGGGEAEFSRDGRTWVPIDDPDLELLPYVIVDSSGSVWLLKTSDPDGPVDERMFVSVDGRSWDRVDLPVEMAAEFGAVVPGAGGFLARTTFRWGLPRWWSDDGRNWQSIETIGLPDGVDFDYWGGAGGFVACCMVSDGHASIFSSGDGRVWTESQLPLPEVEGAIDSVFLRPTWLGDGWIGMGGVFSDRHRLTDQYWFSSDSQGWSLAPTPEFLDVSDRLVLPLGWFAVDSRFTIAVATYDGFRETLIGRIPTGEPESVRVWSTADGITWESGTALHQDTDGVTGGVVDGRGIGLVLDRSSDEPTRSTSIDPVVTTTLPTLSPEQLEPEGLALQDEILADGVVTRQEYERALTGWQTCMEAKGLLGVTWSIGDEGTASKSYGSPDPYAGEQEDLFCSQSYLRRVEDAWMR